MQLNIVSAASVARAEKSNAETERDNAKQTKQKVVTNTGDLGRLMFLVNKFILENKNYDSIKTELENANQCLTQYTTNEADDEQINCKDQINKLSSKVREQGVVYPHQVGNG